jgi:hypothetical protein
MQANTATETTNFLCIEEAALASFMLAGQEICSMPSLPQNNTHCLRDFGATP